MIGQHRHSVADVPGTPPHSVADRVKAIGDDDRELVTNQPMTLAIYAYSLVLVSEVLAQSLLHSHALKGAMVSVALVIAGLCATLDSLPLRISIRRPISRMAVYYTLALFTIGAYMGLVGFFLGNNRYFWAADLFHWFGELMGAFVLGIWVFAGRPARDLRRFVLALALVLGGIGLAVFALGMLDVPLAGGHKIKGLGFWRLDLGRGFPGLILVLVLASSIRRPDRSRESNRSVGLCLTLLSFVLFCTLKRTQWLSVIAVAPLAVVPRRQIAVAGYFCGMLAGIVVLLAIGFPRQARDTVQRVGDLLTYNKNYTIAETIDERLRQWEGLRWSEMGSMLGSGFGAEHDTYVPGVRKYQSVHYVHNLYMYYLFQMGLPVAAASLCLFAHYLYLLWSRLEASPSWEGLVRASLCGVTMLAISGITLISTHSVYAGFILALGLLASQPTHLENRADLAPTIPNHIDCGPVRTRFSCT